MSLILSKGLWIFFLQSTYQLSIIMRTPWKYISKNSLQYICLMYFIFVNLQKRLTFQYISKFIVRKYERWDGYGSCRRTSLESHFMASSKVISKFLLPYNMYTYNLIHNVMIQNMLNLCLDKIFSQRWHGRWKNNLCKRYKCDSHYVSVKHCF